MSNIHRNLDFTYRIMSFVDLERKQIGEVQETNP